MYGNTGLKQQIEDLRDKVSIRDDLVKYLGYRATTAVWRDRYVNAAKRYLADNNDVRIFGVLIRDVPPHEDDIRVRVVRLRNGCSSTMAIELLAIYLPAGSIATLGRKVMSLRKGGAT